MSDLKHTPGPWAGKTINVCNTYEAGCDIGFLCTQDQAARIEGEANARLIAAAPDLLEALKDAVEYLQHHLPDEMLAPHRAAIAKAETQS